MNGLKLKVKKRERLRHRYFILTPQSVIKIKSFSYKSVYLALGVNSQGEKELLGLWIAKTEGVKFWLSVMTELKNRGLQDIFIACCDGLKGFPDAIEAVYPHTWVQLCVVHQVRNSLRYVG